MLVLWPSIGHSERIFSVELHYDDSTPPVLNAAVGSLKTPWDSFYYNPTQTSRMFDDQF
jgi:hypothetical protein